MSFYWVLGLLFLIVTDLVYAGGRLLAVPVAEHVGEMEQVQHLVADVPGHVGAVKNFVILFDDGGELKDLVQLSELVGHGFIGLHVWLCLRW